MKEVGGLVAPIPNCCDFWRTVVVAGETSVRWYPHTLSARAECLESRSDWMVYCPRCGAALPARRAADFERITGIAWDSPTLGTLPTDQQAGAIWVGVSGTRLVSWPFGLADTPYADGAVEAALAVAAIIGASVESDLTDVRVDSAGVYWFANPGAVADRVFQVCATDWDGVRLLATVEVAGARLRRLGLQRLDGALVVPGPHLSWLVDTTSVLPHRAL